MAVWYKRRSPSGHTHKIKLVTWLAIFLYLPIALGFSGFPVHAIANVANSRVVDIAAIATNPYVIQKNETLQIIAKRYGLTVSELQKLNQFRTFSKPFLSLTVGDGLDVPNNTAALPRKKLTPTTQHSKGEHLLTTLLKNSGTAVSAEDFRRKESKSRANQDKGLPDVASQMARSMVVGKINAETQEWLSQFGTADVRFGFNDKNQLDGSSANLLLSLYDTPTSMIYTQVGVHNKSSRNTLNTGVGVRYFKSAWMYGVNSFIDVDISGNHRRAGVGAELWADYFKLSANGYFGLSDWRDSKEVSDYNVRPANGFDLRVKGYLPSYLHLGGELKFEQYWGSSVALFGTIKRQKNPHAVTIGLDYTPIPLVTLGISNRIGNGGLNDVNASLQLNYRLGESWDSQITASSVAARRTLVGSRYDLVERNDEIVLEYQEQKLMTLVLPAQLNGKSGEQLQVSVQTESKYGVEHIEWEGDALFAAGGAITVLASNQYLIRLPAYQLNGVNRYNLSAVAYDGRGNRSNRVSVVVGVADNEVNIQGSQVGLTSNMIPADGLSTTQLIIHLKDNANEPVSAMANQLRFTYKAATEEAGTFSSAIQLRDIKEIAPGQYSASIQAGSIVGDVVIRPTVSNIELPPVTLTLLPAEYVMVRATFDLTSILLTADDVDTSTLEFKPFNADNDLLSGLNVEFIVEGVEGTTISKVIENDGIYTAKIKGNRFGIATLTPVVNGTVITSFARTVTFFEQAPALTNAMLYSMPPTVVANGTATSKVQLRLVDSDNRLVRNADVEFVQSGVPVTLSAITENAGIYSITVSGTTAGRVVIAAKVNGEFVDASSTVLLVPSDVRIGTSQFTVTTRTVAADGQSSSTLAFSAKDVNQNSISGLNVSFLVQGLQDTLVTPVTEEQGKYSANITGTNMGEVTVIPVINGNVVEGLRETITFTASSVVAEKSTLIILPEHIDADGIDTATLSFKAMDKNNNPVTGLQVSYRATGVQDVVVSQATETKGVYNAKLSGRTAGKVTVTPLVNGAAVGGLEGQVMLLPGLPAIQNSTMRISSPSIAADGVATSQIIFTAKDTHNNLINGLNIHFDVAENSGAKISAVTENTGIYSATIRGTKAGELTLVPNINGKAMSELSGKVTFIHGELSVLHSSLTVDNSKIVAEGIYRSTVSFKAVDANGNLISGLDVSFVVKGVANIKVSAVTEVNGVYSATLTGTGLGLATVLPQVNGQTLGNFSTNITLKAGSIAATKSQFSITPDIIAANEQNQPLVTFKAFDSNDNPVKGLNVNFIVHNGEAKISAIKENNGVYQAKLSATTVGLVTVHPQIAGVLIGTLSDSVTVIPDQLDLASSTFVVHPNQAITNNSAEIQIIFRAADRHNNPISELEVGFMVDGDEDDSVSEVVENNGVYTAILNRTTTGTVTITPVVDGKQLFPLNQAVTITSETIDGEKSASLLPANAPASSDSSSGVKFTTRDIHGHPIKGLPAAFSIPLGTLTGTTSGQNRYRIKLGESNFRK